ncbi:MAG TPA: glycosyltransferase family 4 protein [Thermodesulfovibrionales bacterium]|nr:glycosyltransferase family 4 protein [Thermodesulfovibrionales bacterium]
MRILHLLYESRGDPFGIGGVGIRAYEIYKYLKNRHEITLLCKKYPGAEDGEIEGLRHKFVGTESKNFTKTLLSYARCSSLFVKEHGQSFDIIVQEFSPAIPTRLHSLTKKPVVLQIQGYTGLRYFQKYSVFYAAVLYVFERLLTLPYEHFIFVAESSKSNYRIGGNKNVGIIPNGIAEETIGHEYGEDSGYILFLGRIDIHHKGLDILLKAFSGFYSAFPDTRLVIAGDGRDRERFSGLLQNLPENVRRNIELTGWVDGDRKAVLLRNASLVVMPSRYEAQSIVALEAMAYGKCLLVSNIPAFSFVTEKDAGISFRAEDPRSLEEELRRCITLSEDERRKMGQRGRDWARDFTWDKIALKYEDFLSKVLEKQG